MAVSILPERLSQLALMGVLALTLAACVADGADPQAEQRAKAWGQILDKTNMTQVGEDRLRITARGAFRSDVEILEIDALTRAAGEALARNSARFSIVYVDFGEAGLGPSLTASLDNEPVTGWIGTYEDLLAARAESDLDSSLDGSFGYKDMVIVVRLLDESDGMGRETFDAEATYYSLIDDRVARRNIQPNRRLKLPNPGAFVPF